MRDLAHQQLIALDVETTGALSGRPWSEQRVIQLGLVWVDVAREEPICHRYAESYYPGGTAITPGAQRVHGLTLADLKHCRPFSAVAERLHERLSGRVLLTHSGTRFDLDVIDRELGLAGLPPLAPAAEVDTCEILRALEPEQPAGLKAACGRYGVTLEHHHDALADAEATARLWLALRRTA